MSIGHVEARREIEDPIFRSVDVETVGVATPTSQLLDFMIEESRCSCCRRCASSEAVPRESVGLETSVEQGEAKAIDEARACERGLIRSRE